MITSIFESDGHRVTAVWIESQDLSIFHPLTQSYAVCFTKEGKVLVAKDKDWALPGGTVEKGETPEQTLLRELDEEVNIDILACKLLGVQEINFPNNPNKLFGDKFYQSRWVAIISKLKKRVPDPCNGRMFKRRFVLPSEFNEYVKWGDVHKEVFRLAYNSFLNWKNKGVL